MYILARDFFWLKCCRFFFNVFEEVSEAIDALFYYKTLGPIYFRCGSVWCSSYPDVKKSRLVGFFFTSFGFCVVLANFDASGSLV